MSEIRVDNVKNEAGTGAPTFPNGAIIVGNVGSTSLNITGVSTLGNTVVGGATTQVVINGNLRVTGIITTGTSSITIDPINDQIKVGSATTIGVTGFNVGSSNLHSTGLDLGTGNVTSHNINSTGIITASQFRVGTAVTVNSSGVTVTGVITATSFSGDGTNLTNTGSTLSAASGSQRVVLTGQTSGTMTASATDSALTFAQSTGTLSATKFNGDGSALTGIAATTDVRTNSLVVSGVSTFSGITTVTGPTLFAKQLNVSGVSSFSAGSVGAPSITALNDSDTGIYFPSSNTIGIVRSGYNAIRIKQNSSTEAGEELRNQVIINDVSPGSYTFGSSNEVFKVQSYSQSTSGSDFGSVFMHSEYGYRPSNTSYNIYAETRSFGVNYGVYSKTGAGNGTGVFGWSGGGPYSEGAGVRGYVQHTDSNGPGWQPGVWAEGATVGGPAVGAGGAGALYCKVDNHYNSDPVIKVESLYSGSPTRTAVQFIRNSSTVGSITFTLSATAYNTSSDYRLKENIVPLENAEERLRQIPVKRFSFIGDPGVVRDGFIAHEVSPYVPEAIIGIKDEMQEKIVKDSDGNDTFDADGKPILETVPKYQGIDQSKLVPLVTAALQEAFDKIDDLQTRVANLEGL